MAKARIGVRELKDRLSETLARVRRGETVTVTDRNRAVAVIVPAGPEGEVGRRINAGAVAPHRTRFGRVLH